METALLKYSKHELLALLSAERNTVSELRDSIATIEKKAIQNEEKAVLNENIAKDLEQENKLLKMQIEQLKRMQFGQKRERFINSNQLALPFLIDEPVKEEIEAEAVEKISYERKKQRKPHPGRLPLPEHLPVTIIEIEPDCDTTEMIRIGTEVTQVLEYHPGHFYIVQYNRHKYASKDKSEERVVIGELPDRAFNKSIAGPGLVASILTDKYVDHLPLYRQLQRFKRENIPIAPSTMDAMASRGLKLIEILYESLLKETKLKGYLQADETPIKVLDPSKKGKTHSGYYWVYHSPLDKVVLFNYQPRRSTGAANTVLANFKGYLQTDGYSVYASIGKKEGVTHLFCWAHARREFESALSNDKSRAEMALTYIGELYKVEREAREQQLTAEGRKELRLGRSLPVINAFGKWLHHELTSGAVLPASSIGKAFKYTLNRWDGLSAYLQDGELEIDNNLVENAIRPVAIGRKNYLFAGSHDAARRAAAIYSMFAICKKHQINPYKWLKYVFENIMDTKTGELHKLYPQNFPEKIKM